MFMPYFVEIALEKHTLEMFMPYFVKIENPLSNNGDANDENRLCS